MDEKEPGFDVAFTDADVVLRRQLTERRLLPPGVALAFADARVEQVAELLDRLTDVWIVVDPAVADARVTTASLHGVTIQEALDRTLGSAGVRHEVWHEVVFVTAAASPKRAPPPPGLTEAATAARSKRLSWVFSDSLHEVARFLTDHTKVPFVADPAVEGRQVELGFRHRRLGVILDAICRAAELRIERQGDANVFRDAREVLGAADR